MIAQDPTGFGASGHADILENGDCKAGCFFNSVDVIDAWILD